MTLTIHLTPEEAARLEQKAQQEGVDIAQYARRRLGLPDVPGNTPDAENMAFLQLLEAWRKEDATEDEEELERRKAEWQELKRNLNATRAANGEAPLFP